MAIPDSPPEPLIALLGPVLAVLALGLAYRDYTRGRRPWSTATALAAAAVVDAYAALFAAFALTWFLYGSRRPSRTLGWLALALAVALGLAAFGLGPWLGACARWPTAGPRVVPEPLRAAGLWPIAVVTAGTFAALALASRSRGGLDRRVAYALHAAAVAVVLPRVLPPLLSPEPPLRFAGRGLAGGLGVVLSLATAGALALRIARERRAARAPVRKEMPRALTPTLLEADPPPPPPRRWGTLVPLALWIGLLCWRLAR